MRYGICRRVWFLAVVAVVFAWPIYAPAQASTALHRFYQNVHTLAGHFVQIQRGEQGEILNRSSGRFVIARPHKFRWEYLKPYKQVIVSDGDKLWSYDADLSQVTVRPLTQALKGSPALLLSGAPTLDQDFSIRELPPSKGLDWVEVTPKARNGDFRELRLGFDNGVLKVMELMDDLGQDTRLTFSDLTINQSADPEAFHFNPPSGVDVVR